MSSPLSWQRRNKQLTRQFLRKYQTSAIFEMFTLLFQKLKTTTTQGRVENLFLEGVEFVWEARALLEIFSFVQQQLRNTFIDSILSMTHICYHWSLCTINVKPERGEAGNMWGIWHFARFFFSNSPPKGRKSWSKSIKYPHPKSLLNFFVNFLVIYNIYAFLFYKIFRFLF